MTLMPFLPKISLKLSKASSALTYLVFISSKKLTSSLWEEFTFIIAWFIGRLDDFCPVTKQLFRTLYTSEIPSPKTFRYWVTQDDKSCSARVWMWLRKGWILWNQISQNFSQISVLFSIGSTSSPYREMVITFWQRFVVTVSIWYFSRVYKKSKLMSTNTNWNPNNRDLRELNTAKNYSQLDIR